MGANQRPARELVLRVFSIGGPTERIPTEFHRNSLSDKETALTTLTVALIVCTALCLIWKESRGLGIVGVFALIFIAPLLFGSLLVVAALIYYFLFRKSRYEYIPGGNVLPPDDASRRRRGLGLLVVAAGVAGALGLGYMPQDDGSAIHSVLQGVTRSAPAEEIIVVRSPGGLLQTATVKADEVVDATFTHRILGVKIGEVAPRIRCRAYYSYHVKLQPEWRVVRKDGVITALAPPLTPSLPVAIDTATIEKADRRYLAACCRSRVTTISRRSSGPSPRSWPGRHRATSTSNVRSRSPGRPSRSSSRTGPCNPGRTSAQCGCCSKGSRCDPSRSASGWRRVGGAELGGCAGRRDAVPRDPPVRTPGSRDRRPSQPPANFPTYPTKASPVGESGFFRRGREGRLWQHHDRHRWPAVARRVNRGMHRLLHELRSP